MGGKCTFGQTQGGLRKHFYRKRNVFTVPEHWNRIRRPCGAKFTAKDIHVLGRGLKRQNPHEMEAVLLLLMKQV